MRRRIWWAVLLAAGAAWGWDENPRRGGELRVALQAEPRTQDPHLAADEPSELIRYLTAGFLVRIQRQSQTAEPEIASRWEVLNGGRGLRLQLRAGVRFAGGKPVTPADVCYSMRRLLDPKLDAPNGDALRAASGGVECRAAGPAAVDLAFQRPLPAAERWLDGIAIVPDASQPPFPALGPFLAGEQQAGAFVLLRRNPDYWKRDDRGGALPYLDAIRLEIQRNRDFEFARFRKGELHLMNNLDPDNFERLRGTAARDLGVSLDNEFLWFNQVAAAPLPSRKKAWFRQTEFRRAVSLAIRRDDLARVVFKGHASPALGPVSPANKAWFNPQVTPKPADPKAALALLAQAGFRRENGVLKDAGGQAVEFSIVTNAGNKGRERMAAMIQQDLAELGMKVAVVPLDFPSLIERIAKTYQYEACLLGLLSSDLDPNVQMNVWVSSAANHQWNPNQKSPETPWEAELDRLMQQQATETDARKRKQAFDRVQQIVAEQAPFIYLVDRHALVAIGPQVGNASPTVLRPQTLWNAERLFLRQP